MTGIYSKTRSARCMGDRQLDALTRAYLEFAQGALDPNETVKAYSNRMRSNWREAGWNSKAASGADEPVALRILYDMVWAGLRPGIKARIKPFAGEDGRFATIDELFKKAQDVEIKSKRATDSTSDHGGEEKQLRKQWRQRQKETVPRFGAERPLQSRHRAIKAARIYLQHRG
jgi:hypothetical protein